MSIYLKRHEEISSGCYQGNTETRRDGKRGKAKTDSVNNDDDIILRENVEEVRKEGDKKTLVACVTESLRFFSFFFFCYVMGSKRGSRRKRRNAADVNSA